MLRWTIAVLLAANGLYFAWTQGHLAAIGFPPTSEPREPQRLTQQIAPEHVRLLNGPRGAEPPTTPAPAPAPESAIPAHPAVAAAPASVEAPPLTAPAAPTATPTAAAPAAANEPRACWQASGFSPEQAELLRAELRLLGLGGSDWQLTETRSPGRWIVYMGRYDSAEQAARKKAELRAMGVEFRDVNTSGLAPGIALGTFSSEEAAREGLQLAERRNVRTARVVQERAEGLSYSLRLPAIGETVRARIEALGPAMAGRSLQRCN
ncbi:SPOR domain-containing protein [Hydrogenophaga sp. PML113]|uniref:SPOR domain-containing protein n=1 Tax=Hydrogenophaga sp. PML113 TaxID=1899350 RepID=UPI0008788E3F|nr:SPOR domain-containing protein [Hydrogenophaga sp. PML113]